jgi:4-phospho-D-threonate 3-dehydrogenase / 4-phospho-D-erythronate 3-dehydrogenase
MDKIRNVIITSGDPGGIGAEVVIKALARFDVPSNWRVWILGDAHLYSFVSRRMGRDEPWDYVIKKGSAYTDVRGRIILIDFANVTAIAPGHTGEAYGKAAAEYLEHALELYSGGILHSLVTAPICKKSLWLAGFNYAGHTHYLARKTKIKYLTMSMLSRELKVFFVTDHIAFSKILRTISLQRIIKTIERARNCLEALNGSPPALGMCSLNPHGGEEGIFGHEETMIADAVSYWKKQGLMISLPMAPEICFKKAVQGAYQGVIAMYHDQGMIPFKLTSKGRGLNVSLGLPFVRVSPEHGTAFDIADAFSADESSMVNALLFAVGKSVV